MPPNPIGKLVLGHSVRGELNDGIQNFGVRGDEIKAVDPEKRDDCEKPHTFVAIDVGMTPNDGVPICRSQAGQTLPTAV